MLLVIMALASFFIIFPGVRALKQNNLARRFIFHGISQLGYVALAIGAAKPVALAGGFFHALNCGIYIICLFLIALGIKIRTGTLALDKIAGATTASTGIFMSFLIVFLSICAMPPFSGFFSVWMICQGLIQCFENPTGHFTVSMCLACVLFGSTLALVSFVQLLHAIFLSQPLKKNAVQKQRKVPRFIKYIALAFSLLCVLLGIFSYGFSERFIYPFVSGVSITGYYSPQTLAIILICGIAVFLTANYFTGAKNELPSKD